MRAPIILALLLTGCLAAPADPPAALAADVPHAIVQEHDHADPDVHAEASGLALVGSHTLAPDGGARGDWMTGEVIVVGDHAYVVYMGAPWLLAIVDVTDAAAPALVSQFPTTNAWGMDLAVSDDGDWVYVAVYPSATGELFAPGYALAHLGAPEGIAAPGVAVIDARDRTAPRLSSFYPVHGLGPHTVGYHRYPDGREVVFAQKADLQFANSVIITEVGVLPTGDRVLRTLSAWALDAPHDSRQPHDIDVEEHPLTKQTLMYVAHTQAGLLILDVSDPAAPRVVSQTGEKPSSDPEAIAHDVHPYPHLIDGRHFTIATPEIITGDTSGTMLVYDTTDPASPVLVGTWKVGGELVSEEAFSFTMHNFVYLPDGRVALAHGHSGVWIVDWIPSRGEAPLGVAYYAAAFPGAAVPAWSPVHGTPWFWGTAVDARGTLWASDTMGGLVSLAFTER